MWIIPANRLPTNWVYFMFVKAEVVTDTTFVVCVANIVLAARTVENNCAILFIHTRYRGLETAVRLHVPVRDNFTVTSLKLN